MRSHCFSLLTCHTRSPAKHSFTCKAASLSLYPQNTRSPAERPLSLYTHKTLVRVHLQSGLSLSRPRKTLVHPQSGLVAHCSCVSVCVCVCVCMCVCVVLAYVLMCVCVCVCVCGARVCVCAVLAYVCVRVCVLCITRNVDLMCVCVCVLCVCCARVCVCVCVCGLCITRKVDLMCSFVVSPSETRYK
jgi:hypothetical protein